MKALKRAVIGNYYNNTMIDTRNKLGNKLGNKLRDKTDDNGMTKKDSSPYNEMNSPKR